MIRALVVGAALMLGTAVPAAADPAPPTLVTTASFDRPAYTSTDDVHVTLTVENTRADAVDGVRVAVRTNQDVFQDDLGVLADGVRLGAGERITVIVPVRLRRAADQVHVEFSTYVVDAPQGPDIVLDAPLTMLRGSLSGVVYGDQDGDSEFDPGEEMRGIRVTVAGGVPESVITLRTDVNGAFRVPDLPSGDYRVVTWLNSPWRPAFEPDVHVGTGETTVSARAVREQQATLTMTATLDRDTYAVGDTAHEHFVITNPGTEPVENVGGTCGGPGSYALQGPVTGAMFDGTGDTVEAGETRVIDMTEEIPAIAGVYGYINLACSIGPWGALSVEAADKAMVPGKAGELTGVVRQLTGPVVAGMRIWLADMSSGAEVASAVTGADGRFRFSDVPANLYEVRLTGPWQHAQGGALNRQVYGGLTDDQLIEVVPGPVVTSPSVPTSTPVPAPVPQASPVPANLADTGVSVRTLTAFGVLFLLTGAGLLSVRRRPRDVS